MIRPIAPADAPALLGVWRRAVEATHHFLSPAEIDGIEPDVAAYLASGQGLWTLEAEGRPVGFLGLDGDELAALFVDPDAHRRGYGRALTLYALAHGAARLKVNEGNPGARAFYERMGFVAVGRAETDDAGRPWPLVLMALP
ncbi:MAG: GNAT family N-acetyltransferase [Brevundimonas sp.]|uniref:GNAT family N-acetyltransferase n=1 Tax=Brevundimonas sp. TaxID=1871086 RepID=UPI0011F4D180|nr:GNAT family N-acetyltransferase [Brevundimonas sp.]RZJ19204.1 MAG: GNAT family N-acetyltransferase [Brevundimonas sp.]